MAKSAVVKKKSYSRAVGGTPWGLPAQAISVEEKENPEWGEACMDFFDYQSMGQMRDKTDDLRKFRVLSGDFNLKDYSYMKDPLAQLKVNNPNDKEMGGNTASYNPYENIVHYPIMVRPINTILGEYIKRITQLHGFYCKNQSPKAYNEYNRTKTDMLQNWTESQIMAAVNRKVQAMGIKEGTDEYNQAVLQQTPEEIQDFMDGGGYIDMAEKVSQTLLKNMWKDQSLDSEFVEGFKHAAIVAKEFYHIHTINGKAKIDNISPLDVFYHKSPSNKWISQGQYAGFRWMLTPSSVIDLFYNKLSVTDIEEIEAITNPSVQSKKKQKSANAGTISYDTQTYADVYGNINEQQLDATFDMINSYQRFGESSNFSSSAGLIKVVRGYWKSIRNIGWLTTYNENDEPVIEMVDENYKPDKDKGEFLELTPCNQIYTGAKIANDIYIDIGPYQDQIIDLDNLEYCPLPIEGALMNDTHTKPYSLVDLMLPWNELYNIVAYELREDMNSSMGRVLFMSVDHIPNLPGFTMEKWHYWARKFKIAWIKQPKTGGNTFNQFSSADMSFAQQMSAKMEALEQIQQKCDSIAGFSPGRVAGQSTEATLGQSNQQLVASVNQTEYLFFRHSKLIERVLNQALNLAKKAIKGSKYIRNLFDDYELAYIDNDDAIQNQRVGVYVTNSSEDLRKREMLQSLMQPAMQNGADFADLSDMIMSETISEVKQISQKLRRMAKERAQGEQQFRDKELQTKVSHDEQLRLDHLQIEKDRNATRLTEAAIKTFGGVNNSNTSDLDGDGIPDMMEMANFDLKQQDLFTKHMLKQRDQAFVERKHNDDMKIREKELKQTDRRNDIMSKKSTKSN